jgi:D-xylose transport system substrate-binding protein
LRIKTTLVAVASSALLVGGLAAIPTASAAKSKPKTPAVTPSNINPTDFNNTLSALSALKPIIAKGKGTIAVILSDTVSSERWQDFDAPLLTKAFLTMGLKSSQFTVQNAQGSDATQLSDAQAAITSGAKVIILTALDSGTGAQIESLAKAHGVDVIDYDRLVLGGSREVYVSFNNVEVGTLLGNGLISCVAAWKIPSPKVIVMRGAATDNNATLFAQGYEAALAPYFASKGWTQIAQPAGTWDPPTALTEFTQALTANPTANAALTPNDENAQPIIGYLQSQGVKPMTFPTTGQDATVPGIQDVISGYQCGTVYKPIFLEAEGAAAAAAFLRAGMALPKTLLNGTTTDTGATGTGPNVAVPSVLLKPEWVTAKTVESTIVADDFVPASMICTATAPTAPAGQPTYAQDCATYKIH